MTFFYGCCRISSKSALLVRMALRCLRNDYDLMSILNYISWLWTIYISSLFSLYLETCLVIIFSKTLTILKRRNESLPRTYLHTFPQIFICTYSKFNGSFRIYFFCWIILLGNTAPGTDVHNGVTPVNRYNIVENGGKKKFRGLKRNCTIVQNYT